MPIKINGRTYYRTAEAAKMADISRSTLLRWFNDGTIKNAPHRDRRGWRLFTDADIKRIRDESNNVK
jgi:DNA-binding transcriptional MerR regulator